MNEELKTAIVLDVLDEQKAFFRYARSNWRLEYSIELLSRSQIYAPISINLKRKSWSLARQANKRLFGQLPPTGSFGWRNAAGPAVEDSLMFPQLNRPISSLSPLA